MFYNQYAVSKSRIKPWQWLLGVTKIDSVGAVTRSPSRGCLCAHTSSVRRQARKSLTELATCLQWWFVALAQPNQNSFACLEVIISLPFAFLIIMNLITITIIRSTMSKSSIHLWISTTSAYSVIQGVRSRISLVRS